jgi:Raf kinase inhibitor-like YbhB/YbcL family protein
MIASRGTIARMRTLFLALSMVVLGACGGSGHCPETTTSTTTAGAEAPMLRDPTTAPDTITVTIGGTTDGRFPDAQVFNGFGCSGGNQSPALTWTAGPEGTQGYAIVMHDPDAPTGVGFFHWIATDIAAGTTTLAEGASASGMPTGTVQGYTDFGGNAYGGPCPPPGSPHRYEITVYALDTATLGVPPGGTGALTRFMLRQHTLAIGRASATWGR